ncbi:hypothetical protein CCAND38_500032 [Capnocytophaga canis]|uniref:Uncharacterized protein n=1 Tax=Capnocytophaga canis TaxID=1848903 RepID=A0A0B7ID84_9FLAO|nr:hypothetical protein CCAND38_500032 [Capnocytophaga canis]
MVKVIIPLMSAVAPVAVSDKIAVAPINGSFVSLSFMTALNVFCPNTVFMLNATISSKMILNFIA